MGKEAIYILIIYILCIILFILIGVGLAEILNDDQISYIYGQIAGIFILFIPISIIAYGVSIYREKIKNAIFKGKIEKEYRYNWIILLFFALVFISIVLGVLINPMPSLLGNILFITIFLGFFIVCLWGSLHIMVSHLIIYENGIKFIKPYGILRRKLVSWDLIDKIKLYFDYFIKLEILLKNESKSISINKVWVENIEDAYNIMKDHIEPLGGICESIFDFYHCLYCGDKEKIEVGLKYCSKCGNKIESNFEIEKLRDPNMRRQSLVCQECGKFFIVLKINIYKQRLIIFLRCPFHKYAIFIMQKEISPDDIPKKMYRVIAGNINRCEKCGMKSIFRTSLKKGNNCLLIFECPNHRTQKRIINSIFLPKIEEVWKTNSEITDIAQLKEMKENY